MNLRLIPYQEEFAERYLAWRKQPAFVRHNPLKNLGLEELAEVLRAEGSDLSILERYGSYKWFIEAEGEVVGNVSLMNINSVMRFAEIGYGLAESHHGKGIATAAVKMLVDKVFQETDLRKLIAFVHDQNLPSCRILEKIGFKREGLLREHYLINGKPENEVVFGILRADWRARSYGNERFGNDSDQFS